MPQTATEPKYNFSDRTKYDVLMEVVQKSADDARVRRQLCHAA